MRRRAIHVLLGFLFASAFAFGAPAWADPEPTGESKPAEEEADLFAELLAGEGHGEWRGVLNRISEKKDGAWIGQVLGRLFRDRGAYADRVDCAAFTAAYFADRAPDGRVVLGDAIVARAQGDEAFLEALRSHITKGEGGWGRLLDHAREQLAQVDPNSQAAAVWFLSREDGDQGERVRRELEARAREVAEDADPARRARLEAIYLAGFARFLGYRFASLDEVLQTLEELKGLDLARLTRALSLRKDLPTSPDRRALLEYGKRLVDEVVQSGDPEGLAEFLDRAHTPYVLLRRYAIQKAAQMKPEPGAVWGRVLRIPLAGETDTTVLQEALTILERTGFANEPEEAARLSAELARRLERRGPDAAEGRDPLADRVRMAKLVGSLKTRPPELDALLAAGERLETEVVGQLVRALGGILGTPAKDILAFYRVTSDDPARDRSIRIAVVDALGRPGLSAEGSDAAAAAAALREILSGDGAENLGRATDRDVRQHAIRSLGSHASPETAGVLGSVVLGADAKEAGVAVVVLRKAATSNPHAARALAEAAGARDLAPERRIQALEALAELGGAEAESLEIAAEASRGVLASEEEAAPDEVRLEAAATCATLADPLALDVVFDWWAKAPDADRASALRTLLLGVAKSTEEGAHDARLRATLLAVGQSGAWDQADAWSQELLADAPRAPIGLARAQILLERGLLDGEVSARRAWLAESAALLEGLLAGEDAPADTAHLLVRVLAAAGELAPTDEERKALYLRAVTTAVAGSDVKNGVAEDGVAKDRAVALAQLGLEVADRLQQEPLSALLTEAEVETLTEARRTLQARLGS